MAGNDLDRAGLFGAIVIYGGAAAVTILVGAGVGWWFPVFLR